VPHSFELRKPELLRKWQERIGSAARAAFGDRSRSTKEVFVVMRFSAKPRGDQAHGTPWTTPVTWDCKAGKSAKADPHVPDLDNLGKAVLDVMAGIVLANDVSVASIFETKVYGPESGVKV
jgi:Holliday junction resolvase RusA-like endonuclease